MQLSKYEKQKIDIWERMRTIEGELFLLSAKIWRVRLRGVPRQNFARSQSQTKRQSAK